MKKIYLHPEQQYKLEELWFIYGNHGKKFTMANHRFIQTILEQGKDSRDFFKPTQECIEAVDKIIIDPNDKVKNQWGGKRANSGRKRKASKVRYLRSPILFPRDTEEKIAMDNFMGMNPEERLRFVTDIQKLLEEKGLI